MDRFADMLYYGLIRIGHEVRLLKPPPVAGRFRPSPTGLGKWLGYFDRFIRFKPNLKKAAKWADVVHICDHSNSVYLPWLKRKPHMVTCHDMLAIRCALGEIRENKTGASGRIYQRWILSCLTQARYVACVSEATQKDLVRFTGIVPEKVSVVRNGLNFPYQKLGVEEALHHLQEIISYDISPFFLHVGGNFWYKNRTGLLRIFSGLNRCCANKRPHLVLAGEGLSPELKKLAYKLGVYDFTISLPDVSNRQLCALYSLAHGLLFPSLAEGFGWPIIEAQACGCPVFTSNRPSMVEVGGNGAVYFDPFDEAGAVQIIYETLQNKNPIIDKGYRNAMKYSTEAMIYDYDRIYRSIVT